MQPSDLTIAILRGIRQDLQGVRDEVQGVRDEVRITNGRLDETNMRLDRLDRRQGETEVRLATELVAVASAVRDVRDLLRADLLLRDRVDDHERRIGAVEGRLA